MIGSSSNSDAMNEWFREALPVARSALAAFPTLNEFLRGFEGYESKAYLQSRNFVLANCLPTIKGELVTEQMAVLAEFERALGVLGVKGWSRTKLGPFVARITSNSFDDGLSLFTEFMIAYRLNNAFGGESVEIYPRLSNGKISDVAVSTGGSRVFLEIGNLTDSQPELIIQRVLKAGAEHLGGAIAGNRYMQVEVDTVHFVFDDKGQIDEAQTVAKLNREVDGLGLSLLAPVNCSVDMKMTSEIVRNMPVYQAAKRFMPENFAEVLDAIQEGPLNSWAKSANFGIVSEGMLVQSVMSYPAKALLVEFHTRGFYPSKSAEAEGVSFANHIVRHVRSQVGSGQIESESPNLILVQGYNWVASMLGVESALQRIYEGVHKMFSVESLPDVAGVGLFSKYPSDGYYVHNPATKISNAEKACVSSLGMNWVN